MMLDQRRGANARVEGSEVEPAEGLDQSAQLPPRRDLPQSRGHRRRTGATPADDQLRKRFREELPVLFHRGQGGAHGGDCCPVRQSGHRRAQHQTADSSRAARGEGDGLDGAHERAKQIEAVEAQPVSDRPGVLQVGLGIGQVARRARTDRCLADRR